MMMWRAMSDMGEIAFNPDTTTDRTTEYISDFRYRAQISPSAVESQDYTFKTPGWPGYYSHDGGSLNRQRTRYEIYDYLGRFKDEQHRRDFTRYRMEGLRNDAETGVCFCNTPKLWPGARFRLTGNPSGTLNRKWQVVGSVLSGEQPQALHGSQGEGTTLGKGTELNRSGERGQYHPEGGWFVYCHSCRRGGYHRTENQSQQWWPSGDTGTDPATGGAEGAGR